MRTIATSTPSPEYENASRLVSPSMARASASIRRRCNGAIRTPEGCVELAFTEACPHIFRVRGKPFWAFQFHPEVNRDILVERLTVFKEHYTDGDEHLQQVLDDARETPESNHLVTKFVDRVLMGDDGASGV